MQEFNLDAFSDFIKRILFSELTVEDYILVIEELFDTRPKNTHGKFISFKSMCHNIDLHIVDGNYLNDEEKDEAYCFDDIELYYKDELEFYEWIEDELAIPDQIEEPYYSNNIVNKLSVEICNLRGLDLTDENIRLIVEEFMEEK